MSLSQNLLLAKTQESNTKIQFKDIASNPKTLPISIQEKSNFCQSISFDRYVSNCFRHFINEKSGEVMVNFVGQKNKMNDDDYNLSNSQLHEEESGLRKTWIAVMVKLKFDEDGGGGAHAYFEAAFQLSDKSAVKMFKQGWFHFDAKISKDIVLGGVTDIGFLLVVVGKILLDHQDCEYSSLLSIKRKSIGGDCYSSLPMTIITRYDFHHDVLSHFYSGTSKLKRSTEVINTNCLGVRNSLDIIGSTFPTSISDDIIIEILSRLPVKSLMRFKLVCKHWLFMIKQDQYLIDLHFNYWKSHPNLLYINPLQEKGIYRTSHGGCFDASKTLCQSILCAEIVDQGNGHEEEKVEAFISKVRITDDQWFPYDEILGPVNGLVCFIDRKTYAVRIYNVSTREATPWVKSTLLAKENGKLIKNKDNTIEIKNNLPPIYQFGFDPEKKEYKVFCFWRLGARPEHFRWNSWKRHDYAIWEVLTVGHDTKWRKINMVPNEKNKIIINEVLSPYEIGRQPVYANGTLYWSNKVLALDVGSEMFRVIPIPNFILDEPREKSFRRPIDMLILGGRVALLFRMEFYVVKLWMLDDGSIDKKLENCQGSQSNWSAETIQIPFKGDSGISGFGVAGSNEAMVVFRCHNYKKYAGYYEDRVSLYSYDGSKKSCKKIEIDRESLFPLRSSRSLITSFTESLYSI
ncbi:hypothetical protein MKX03_003319 [Papaver bracteatum]|nr:hypothetical protein MKX03_003319 [Papaver bracteatum]